MALQSNVMACAKWLCQCMNTQHTQTLGLPTMPIHWVLCAHTKPHTTSVCPRMYACQPLPPHKHCMPLCMHLPAPIYQAPHTSLPVPMLSPSVHAHMHTEPLCTCAHQPHQASTSLPTPTHVHLPATPMPPCPYTIP